MNKLLPKTRTTDIIEQEAGNELMIYDLRNNKAYTLNETSKNVYKACDGAMTFEDLQNRYKYTDDLIHFALDSLTENNLIDDYRTNHFTGMSRREVIRKVGLASMIALPVISSLTAPSAASASSLCIGNGQSGGPGVQRCAVDAADCSDQARTLCFSCTATFSTGDQRCVDPGNPSGGICTCN